MALLMAVLPHQNTTVCLTLGNPHVQAHRLMASLMVGLAAAQEQERKNLAIDTRFSITGQDDEAFEMLEDADDDNEAGGAKRRREQLLAAPLGTADSCVVGSCGGLSSGV